MGPVGHFRKSVLDNKHHGQLGQIHCFFIVCAVTIVCPERPFESLLRCHEADKRCRVLVLWHFMPQA